MNSIAKRMAWQALVAVVPAGLLCGATGIARVPLSFEPGVRSSEFVASPGGSRIVLTPEGAAIGESRMRLLGARANVRARPEELLPGYSNYLVGDPRKWRTHVPNYRRVRYQNVYPGIDVVYYGNPRELEFDFVVAPGADPRRIQLALSGDFQIRLPRVYQADREVAGRVVRHGGRVTFDLAPYDHARALVIDPVLSYASLFGGGGSDGGRAIAVDAAGDTYVVGDTGSGNFPAANGQPGRFSFLAKLNPDGSAFLYSTYLPSFGYGAAYAVDASGGVYLVQESGPDIPVIGPPPLKRCTSAGGPDIAVAKLAPDGASMVYAGCLGGSAAESPTAIATDAAGNAYITGTTQSPDFPLVKPIQSTHPSTPYFLLGFVLKLGPDGTLLYSTFLGGGIYDNPRAIAADRAGNAYVTGQTSSPDFPLKNAVQSGRPGNGPTAFVTKINADGSTLVYSTYLGGSSGDLASAIAADASGNAYIAGNTPSPDFPATPNAFQPRFSGVYAFKTTDGGTTWGKSDSGLPGPAFSIQVDPLHPAVVYALSSGRLFKSSDRGATWSATTADSPGAFWINPADSTLYASSSNGKLLRSRDAAASFTTVQTGVAGFINQMAFDWQNASTIYGRWGGSGPGDGVYKSIDAGDTWKATGLIGNGEGRGGLVVDPAHSSTLYATSNRKGLIQSDDGGETWTTLDGGLSGIDLLIDSASKLFVLTGNGIVVRSGNTSVVKATPGYANKFVIDPANSSTWYAVVYGSGVYKSTDSGDTWQLVDDHLPDPYFIQSLSLDPMSPGTLYLGASAPADAFFAKLSSDGSTLPYATYLGGSGADSANAIAVDADGNAYVAGTTGSSDFPVQAPFRTGGTGFVARFDPTNNLVWSSSLGAAQPNGIALGPTGEVYLTGTSSDAGFPTANTIQAFNTGNLFRTTDGGTTWSAQTLPNVYPFVGISAIAADPVTPSHVLAIADRLYESIDRGQSWRPLGKTGFVPISPVTFVLDPLNPTTIYGGGYPYGALAGVSKTTDGGATWAVLPGAANVVYGLAIDPKTPSTLYAAEYYSGMYKTTDSGASWTAIGSLAYAAAVAVDPSSPAVVYASVGEDFPVPNAAGSIYKSTDAGATWNPVNKGLPSQFYANILIADPAVPGRVYAVKSFFTGGMYRTDDGGSNWIAIGAGLPDSVVKVLVVDPSHSSTLYAAPSTGGLYRSLDSGATWNLMSGLRLALVTSIAVDPSNSTLIYVGTQSDPGDAFVMKVVP